MYQINVKLPVDGIYMEGTLTLPVKAESLIIFARGNGPYSDGIQKIVKFLQRQGFGTLLYGLSNDEPRNPENLDPDLLAERLIAITLWITSHSEYRSLEIAFLGSGVGAAAALKASGMLGSRSVAVVSCAGRTDLVKKDLKNIFSPVLLIAGEFDFHTIKINREAMKRLNSPKQLIIVPGASHLFEEPGKLDHVIDDINRWLQKYLGVGSPGPEIEYDPTETDNDQ